MVKGVSIKLVSYEETLPKLLSALKFDQELKKHNSVVLKVNLDSGSASGTRIDFVEPIVKFCVENKNPSTEIIIAEGSDRGSTMDHFAEKGYHELAEKYGVGIIDLNDSESEAIKDTEFLRFESVNLPVTLKNSFVISLPKLSKDENGFVHGALSNMLGAFPARHYRGFFAKDKNKIKQWPIKYSIHDVLVSKMPNFAIIDASDKGVILAGRPLEIDKQAVELLGMDWRNVDYLKLVEQSLGATK